MKIEEVLKSWRRVKATDEKGTTIEFPSVNHAAKFLKLSQSSISCALHGHSKSSGGYIWKHINKKHSH